MSTSAERILIVENDPRVSDLIARQALGPMGYRVKVAENASQAIQEAARFSPDVVLVNMNLPGLSGKDLLVALSSQGVAVPTIVLAEDGQEADVIQAFRLGATDYLKWPLREAEVVSAVERSLQQVRARRERERLTEKLAQTNRELQRRVRDLTTIFSIGKSVTSVTDQRTLFDRMVEGAVFVTEADRGWLHLRMGNSKNFALMAYRNLPNYKGIEIGQPWDDGISSLVALSGETLSIHGSALENFKAARLGKSALVVPVKAQEEVVGILVVMREKALPFDDGNQAMLEALSDYASISLMNARLFQVVEQRARSSQPVVDVSGQNGNMLAGNGEECQRSILEIEKHLAVIMATDANLIAQQRRAIQNIRTNLEHIKKALRDSTRAREVGS